jgi:hypothetical protein
LLRVDKVALFESRIARAYALASSERGYRFERFTRALEGKPLRRLTLQNVKVSLAALVSVMSMVSKRKLTAREIRDLFDAFAREGGIGHIDPDLPSPEAFEKGIQRERAFWRPMFKADK